MCKTAIIIGATSGIGKELTLQLVKDGYKVGITGRRLNLLQDLQNEYPHNIEIQQFDISNIDTIFNNFESLMNKLGECNLCIISAGTGDINKTLSPEIEQKTIATNVLGFTAVIDWIFNYFVQHNGGHIVGISSLASLRGSAAAPAYNASKAYQSNYMEGLRQKANKLNKQIYITDIRPGLVDTAMAKGDGLFWVAPVNKAVTQIYKAIKNKKKVAYITKRWCLIAFLFKIMPRAIYERI